VALLFTSVTKTHLLNEKPLEMLNCTRPFVRFISALLFALFATFALNMASAQQPQGPVLTEEIKPASPPTAPTAATGTSAASPYGTVGADGSDVELSRVVSDFRLLKLLGFVAVGLAVVAGWIVYAIRHRRVQKYDTLFALTLTILLAPLLFYLATRLLSTDSAACLGLALGGGADASAFSDGCRAARESAANLFGFASLWALTFGQTIVNGIVAPLAAGVVNALMYASVTLAAPLIFLLTKPLVKAFLNKK